MTKDSTDEVQRLQQELTRANYILEGAGLGSWDWWLETNKVAFDQRWCAMLGLDPATTPNELSTWETRVHPDDKAGAYADIKACLDGKARHYENLHRMQHRDGHWVWILDRGRISEYDKNGKPIRFTGTHFDVTAYKEKETLDHMIQTIAGVGGWELDVATGKTKWTEQTYHIHGIAPDTPTDKIMGINFYASHERERITKAVLGSFEGTPFRGTFEFVDANGKLKWVESMGQPVKNAEGKVYKVIGTFRDVSDEHRRLSEIEKARHELQVTNERMAAVLEHAPIALYECLLDKDWTMNYLSRFIQDISGHPPDDFTEGRRTFGSMIHPDDREMVAKEIEVAVNSNRIYDLKYRIHRSDGDLCYVHEKGQISKRTGNLVGVLLDITAQSKFQDDLENIFENSIDMMCIANFEGYFVRVSPSFTRILGYSEEELLSQPYLNFVVSEDKAKTSDEADNSAQGGDTIRFENRYRCKNGKVVIMAWNARSNPKTGFIYAVVRDVTEERNREHKNQQILEALERAWIISETDAKGRITYANQNFCDISKYSKDELVGQDHRILNSGGHDREFFEGLWSNLTKGSFWEGQIQNRAKDGEKYHVNTVIMPVKDMVTGEVRSYFSVRQDVTQEITSRQALEEAEVAGRFGNYRFNLRTRNATWSKGHNLVFGFELDAPPDFQRVLTRIHPEDRGIMLSELEKIEVRGAREFHMQYRIVMDDQSIKHIESYGRVSSGHKNEAELVVGVVLDITEKIELERKMAQQRIQLIHASKLASLGEMAAGIAHEINNPLAVIVGSIPLVSKHKNDDVKLNSKLETMSRSAERIDKIVKGLRKFSRTSDGSLHESELLADLVAESLVLTEANAKRHSTSIEVMLEPALAITCDGVEIEQVLVNLINNGIDAVRNQENRWVKVRTFSEGAQIVLQVTDSGGGVSSEVEKSMFQPFFTTKAVGEGTGLGLSIVKGILDDHKASIALNRSMTNTCFEIRFPKAASNKV